MARAAGNFIASAPSRNVAMLKNGTTLIQFPPRQEVCDAYFRRRQFPSGEFIKILRTFEFGALQKCLTFLNFEKYVPGNIVQIEYLQLHVYLKNRLRCIQE